MRDFETHPIGTAKKIRQLEDRRDAYEVVIAAMAAALFGILCFAVAFSVFL